MSAAQVAKYFKVRSIPSANALSISPLAYDANPGYLCLPNPCRYVHGLRQTFRYLFVCATELLPKPAP